MAMPGMAATSEPVAMTMDFASTDLLLAVDEGDLDLSRRGDAPAAVEVVDLVLLQQILDALHVALHALILEGKHGGEIELGLDLDAHGGEPVRGAVGGFRIALARMQQRL